MSGGNNMESLLLGGDSSSGESDDEQEPTLPPTNVPAAASIAASVAQQQQNVVSSPNAMPHSFQTPNGASTSSGGGSSMTQSDISRLKSLYSPASSKVLKGTVAMPSPTAASAPSSRPPIPMQSPNNASSTIPSASSGLVPRPSIPPPMVAATTRTISGQPSPAPTVTAVTSSASLSSSSSMVARHQQQPQSMRPLVPNRQQAQPLAQVTSPQQSNERFLTPTSALPPDPFEPTPLQQIKERQQQKNAAAEAAARMVTSAPMPTVPQPMSTSSSMPQSQQQQPLVPSNNVYSSGGSANSTSSSIATVKVANATAIVPPTMGNPAAASNSSSSAASAAAAAALAVSNNTKEALKRKKERFLMFARVLMKYLEQKDPVMHLKAKDIIKDCADRNKRQEKGYESVTASMQQRLHQVVGEAYWKRAESYLAHFLKQKQKETVDKQQKLQQQQRVVDLEHSRKVQKHQQQLPHAAAAAATVAAKGPLPPSNRTISDLRHEVEAKRQSLQAAARPQNVTSNTSMPPPSSILSSQQAATSTSKPPMMPPSTTSGPPPQQQHAATGTPAPQVKPLAPVNPMNSASASANKGGKKDTQAAVAAAAAKRARASPALSSTTSASAAAARKTPTTSAAAAVTTPTKPASEALSLQQAPPPPREYSELMEMVDHAVNYDWTSAGLLFSPKNSAELQLKEEQRKLLFGDASSSLVVHHQSSAYASSLPVVLQGWGQRNLVTPRAAWARVRLPEVQQHRRSRSSITTVPVVGGGLLTLPSRPLRRDDESSSLAELSAHHTWINEHHAEEDLTLAVLSQGAEIYVKTLVEKALHCARQRQNLDAIRLCHQQHATATGGSSSSNPPSLSLRLGCDVKRQVAQMQGNASMICKRMEQALERQTHVSSRDRVLHQSTLANASSMADLSLRPALAKAVETADITGKRSFEVYGGKDADQPPFGRVPKQAKLELVDFTNGMELVSPKLRACQRQGLDVIIPWN